MSASAIALLLPSIRSDLSLSFTQSGSLGAANIFSYALMQIPAGYLADRYGLKQTFLIGAFGTTALLFAFGFVADYRQAFLIQTLAGVFHAFLFQSALALLASRFGAERRATAMGLSLVGIFSGQLLINSVAPSLAGHFNWRFPFLVFGLAGLLSSCAYFWLGRGPAGAEPARQVGVLDALRFFRDPFMLVCGMIQFIRLGTIQGIAFWLPSLLIDEKGLALGTTGFILALRTLFIAPSNMLGGYLSDKLRQPTAIMALSLVVLAVTTAALIPVGWGALLIALIMLNAMFVQFYFGPIFALPLERYGARLMGTLSGFGNFLANLGAFGFTYGIGALKDQTGFFGSGFYAIAVASVVGLALTFWLEKMRCRQPVCA